MNVTHTRKTTMRWRRVGRAVAALTENLAMPMIASRTLLLVAALTASGYAVSSVAADATPRVEKATTATKAIAPQAAVSCRANADGVPLCDASGYDVQLRGCGEGALYGRIWTDGGIDVNQSIDGHGKAVARLKKGQFVCSVATASKGDEQRHFVVPVDTASVRDCKGNELCKNADLPIEWKVPKPEAKCDPNVAPSKGYANCAAGWVGDSDLDAYSMGLKVE